MSWRENIDTNISIVCGDGKSYSPLYRISPRDKNYHHAQYNFVNISGTFVARKLPESYTQTVELIFQGENHLIDVEEFLESADDPRPWNVYHPMFPENLVVQPLRISQDPTGLSLTIVSVQWMETIEQVRPSVTIDPSQAITGASNAADVANAEAYDVAVLEPAPQDRALMQSNIDVSLQTGEALVLEEVEANKFYDLYRTASASINGGIDRGQQLASGIITFMTYPALFTSAIKARLLLLKNQFIQISIAVNSLDSVGEKAVYEMQGGALLSAMANASIQTNTDQELNSAPEIAEAISILTSTYNTFLKNLDGLQTEFAGLPESYSPNVDFMTELDSLVNLAASQLYIVALNARQEREFVTTEDSNLILLTHRVYGLTPGSDQQLNDFINQNGIGLSEMLQIKKGRKIVYYV